MRFDNDKQVFPLFFQYFFFSFLKFATNIEYRQTLVTHQGGCFRDGLHNKITKKISKKKNKNKTKQGYSIPLAVPSYRFSHSGICRLRYHTRVILSLYNDAQNNTSDIVQTVPR